MVLRKCPDNKLHMHVNYSHVFVSQYWIILVFYLFFKDHNFSASIYRKRASNSCKYCVSEHSVVNLSKTSQRIKHASINYSSFAILVCRIIDASAFHPENVGLKFNLDVNRANAATVLEGQSVNGVRALFWFNQGVIDIKERKKPVANCNMIVDCKLQLLILIYQP